MKNKEAKSKAIIGVVVQPVEEALRQNITYNPKHIHLYNERNHNETKRETIATSRNLKKQENEEINISDVIKYR